MINPDGVRYGNYRTCAFGYDLNRKWKKTFNIFHKNIFALKQFLEKLN